MYVVLHAAVFMFDNLVDLTLDWQNWEKSAYVYEREANCTECRKDMLIMSFRFKVTDLLIGVN